MKKTPSKASGRRAHSKKGLTDAAQPKSLLDRAFEVAMQMKNRGEIHKAATLLELLAQQYPGDWRVPYSTGGVYFHDLGSAADAIPFYRKAVELRPLSERASLGLFHTLWAAGHQLEALDEVKRFQSVSHSADYDNIVAELAKA